MDFGDLFDAGERSRIELLTLELDLAFNFARIAEQYRDGPSRKRALRCSQVALGAVRHFEGRICDPANWRTIHERADELERFLALLEQVKRSPVPLQVFRHDPALILVRFVRRFTRRRKRQFG